MRRMFFELFALALYGATGAYVSSANAESLKSISHGDMAGLIEVTSGATEPAIQFLDSEDRTITLADLHPAGKLLILNFWATWCGGCRLEMPTLAKLQADFGNRIIVIPISVDSPNNRQKAREFMAHFPQLAFYQYSTKVWPPAFAAAMTPPIHSYPTTIIYDGTERERAMLSGATADWSGHDAQSILKFFLDEH